MKDSADNRTVELLLEGKRAPGRPRKSDALTPAEKQRAYRERLKVLSPELLAARRLLRLCGGDLALAVASLEQALPLL